MAAVGPDGIARCSSRESIIGRDYGTAAWFADLRQGARFVIGDLQPGTDATRPALILALAFPSAGNKAPQTTSEFLGALLVSIDVGQFSPLTPRLSWPSDGTMSLIDRNGEQLTDALKQPDAPSQLPVPSRLVERMGDQIDTFVTEGQDRVRRLYAVAPVASGRLYFILGLPLGRRLGWLEPTIVSSVFAPTAILLFGVVAIWIATNMLVNRHVRVLAKAARQWSLGRLDVRPDLADAPSELRDLGSSFTQMAGRLAAREDELRSSLAHKEALLREIHHRVKNNLQIVSSLLSLRTRAARNDDVRQALEEVQLRIDALALVHRNLYEHDEPAVVELNSFLSDLGRLLVGTADPDMDGRIGLTVQVQPALIAADRAMPIALLVTELVTNSIRHAFPGGRSGTIKLSLERDGAMVRLVVQDDGIGITTTVGTRDLGLTLSRLLAKQIGGQLEITGPPGTVISITFAALPDAHPR
jgi:two-component sensor histidine kinase